MKKDEEKCRALLNDIYKSLNTHLDISGAVIFYRAHNANTAIKKFRKEFKQIAKSHGFTLPDSTHEKCSPEDYKTTLKPYIDPNPISFK